MIQYKENQWSQLFFSLSLFPGVYALWEMLHVQRCRRGEDIKDYNERRHRQWPGNHVGHPARWIPACVGRNRYIHIHTTQSALITPWAFPELSLVKHLSSFAGETDYLTGVWLGQGFVSTFSVIPSPGIQWIFAPWRTAVML